VSDVVYPPRPFHVGSRVVMRYPPKWEGMVVDVGSLGTVRVSWDQAEKDGNRKIDDHGNDGYVKNRTTGILASSGPILENQLIHADAVSRLGDLVDG